MLEPINLLRYSKYGFLLSSSALISLTAMNNPMAKQVLYYGWFIAIFLSLLALFWKDVENGTRLLTGNQAFELIVLICLVSLGILIGML